MAVQLLFRVLICLSISKLISAQNMDGFIVGGNFSVIEDFPHVAFLSIKCQGNSYCGASIINQVILLTAAHCLHSCSDIQNYTIHAYTGHVQKYKGHKSEVIGFEIHEHYNHRNYTNDIAMMILKDDLKFGPNVLRISLVKTLPVYDEARIAGWGWIDDYNTKTDVLKYTSQTIMSYEECLEKLPGIPKGTICGYNPSGSHPQRGDSGSALVIHNHIQIGLASYFRRRYSNTTLVYTDVPYFYDWIQHTATSLFCQFKLNYISHHEENVTITDDKPKTSQIDKYAEKKSEIKRKIKERKDRHEKRKEQQEIRKEQQEKRKEQQEEKREQQEEKREQQEEKREQQEDKREKQEVKKEQQEEKKEQQEEKKTQQEQKEVEQEKNEERMRHRKRKTGHKRRDILL